MSHTYYVRLTPVMNMSQKMIALKWQIIEYVERTDEETGEISTIEKDVDWQSSNSGRRRSHWSYGEVKVTKKRNAAAVELEALDAAKKWFNALEVKTNIQVVMLGTIDGEAKHYGYL